MQISLTASKILKSGLTDVLSSRDWSCILLNEGLYVFEQLLHDAFTDLYDKFAGYLIQSVSQTEDFVAKQGCLAAKKGLKKLVCRPAQVQLRTGTKIRYDSLYAKKVPEGYEGDRHLSLLVWHSKSGASPMYKSLSCLSSVLCPSFSVAKDLLRYQGIKANYNRVRHLSLSLAEDCMEDRANVQLEAGEDVVGKHVIIGIDGGRTRTKEYKEQKSSKRAQKFATPWREPKMFVITTIDEDGQVNKESKPIYDGTFGDEQMIELLAQYLKRLQIQGAASVQILADGALWIWNRVGAMLRELGVNKDNILETLDYYHAMEHLHDLKVYLKKEEQQSLFAKLKQSLWTGDITKMEDLIKQGVPGVKLEEFTPYKYFEKNKNRIDYQLLKAQSRPCGSGIIESGIRRIINLRFKSPSTFWFPQNVEKLILMRGIALSGRWEIMMNNLTI